MQNQLTAFEAFCGEEAGCLERGSDRCGGELVSQVAKRFDGNITGDLAFQFGFLLLRVVPQRCFRDRNAGRCVPERLNAEELPAELNPIDLQMRRQCFYTFDEVA